MVRRPAVAGTWYPGSAQGLKAMIQGFLDSEASPKPALLAVSPHAGYIYSGAVAGKVFSRVSIPRKVVVAGVNHRGAGSSAALMTQGTWETPLGSVKLDGELGQELLGRCPLLDDDPKAHQYEHSLELQVPFLQYFQNDLLLTPLALSFVSYDECLEIGRALAESIRLQAEPVLMVASTDMTHHEPAEAARQRDMKALEQILALNPKGLFETVRHLGITMCGVLPTTVCLLAAKELGASRAELVAYTNSGEATGDFRQVVGYAGLIIN